MHSLKVVAEIERSIGNSKLFLAKHQKIEWKQKIDDKYINRWLVWTFSQRIQFRNVDIQPNQIVNNQDVLNCIITYKEICTSIKNLRKGKSTGLVK